MDDYYNEMFNYLTREDNYKSANELSDLLPGINDRLRKEFWVMVAKKLNEKTQNNLKSRFVEQRNGNGFTIRISKDDAWGDDIAIGLDHALDLGILIKRNSFPDNLSDKVREYELDLPSMHHENKEWLCYDPIDNVQFYSFQRFNELREILPERRDIAIDKMVGYITEFVNKVILICDKINELKN